GVPLLLCHRAAPPRRIRADDGGNPQAGGMAPRVLLSEAASRRRSALPGLLTRGAPAFRGALPRRARVSAAVGATAARAGMDGSLEENQWLTKNLPARRESLRRRSSETAVGSWRATSSPSASTGRSSTSCPGPSAG